MKKILFVIIVLLLLIYVSDNNVQDEHGGEKVDLTSSDEYSIEEVEDKEQIIEYGKDEIIEVSSFVGKSLDEIQKVFKDIEIGYDKEEIDIYFNGPEGSTDLFGYNVYGNGVMSAATIEENMSYPCYSIYGITSWMTQKEVEKLLPGDFKNDSEDALYYEFLLKEGFLSGYLLIDSSAELYYSSKRHQILIIDYEYSITCFDASAYEDLANIEEIFEGIK